MKKIRGFSRLAIVSALVLSIALIAEAAHADAGSIEAHTSNLVNSTRAGHGLPGLARSAHLDAVARSHSARMAASGGIFHNANLAGEVGGGWAALGENVGMGQTTDAVHDAFMNSPSHAANILGSYDSFGIGAVESGGGVFITQVFSKSSDVAAYSAPTSVKKCRKVKGRTRCTSVKKYKKSARTKKKARSRRR